MPIAVAPLTHTDFHSIVNFVGPRDEYVVSGSDDGLLFNFLPFQYSVDRDPEQEIFSFGIRHLGNFWIFTRVMEVLST